METPEPEDSLPSESDIEKVRRILFGERIDTVETKVESVRTDLRAVWDSEARNLRDEIRGLESAIRERVDGLEKKTADRGEIAAALRDLADRLEAGPQGDDA